MPIINPTQLVDEFKKSGEFDRLRRELLAQFRVDEDFPSFMSRVEDIIQKKLASDNRLLSMSEASVNRELTQELNRYPLVERSVAEAPSLNNPAFAAAIRQSVSKILRQDREGADTGQGTTDTTMAEGPAKPALAVETQSAEPHSGVQTPAKEDEAIRGEHGEDKQPEGADGNDSEDSAMLESPLSGNNPSEAGTPLT